MDYTLDDPTQSIDDQSGELVLPDGVRLLPAAVAKFEFSYYRAIGAGVGQFTNLPSPRLRMILADGSDILMHFPSGEMAVIALGQLQAWQNSALPA